MRLVLCSTSDLSGHRGNELARMIASVTGQAAAADIPTTMLLLLQRGNQQDELHLREMLPPGSTILSSRERLSLSEARNQLLAVARTQVAPDDDCIVGFPDDDCWYPPGFLAQLTATFSNDTQLDMLICRVSLAPVVLRVLEPNPARAWQVVRRASSNSMFFRGGILEKLGDFDPGLGLGTHNGSGEDTDYAVRGFLRARKAVFVDLPLVGHRASDLSSVARYFKGSLLVLARHALARPDLCFEYSRKLGVGAWLAVRSRLTLREYCSAIAGSLRELQRSAHGAR